MYFSVVIPLYNKEGHIRRAVDSVLKQTYPRFELIVVDDGSTDDGVLEVNKIPDERVSLIRQKNAGVSAARNRGIKEARFEYIAFLDADDAWDSQFLEKVADLIRNFPKAGAYVTGYRTETDHGKHTIPKHIKRDFTEGWKGYLSDYFAIASKNLFISASSVVIPKRVFDAVGYFPIGIRRGEDLEMWRLIALQFPIAYSNQILATVYLNAMNRESNRKASLMDSSTRYADVLFEEMKSLPAASPSYREYLYRKMLKKTKYLIFEGNRKEARRMITLCRSTKRNRLLLIVIICMYCMPKILWDYIR